MSSFAKPFSSSYRSRANLASRSVCFSKNYLRTQSGFTLVEILLVLGIIAVLVIAAFVIFPKVKDSARANLASENIKTITAGTKNLFAASGRYELSTGPGDLTATLIKAKIIPDDLVDASGTTLHSNFDPAPDSLSISSNLTGIGSANGAIAGSAEVGMFDIKYLNVPSALCNKITTGFGDNFANVLVNGVSVFTTTLPYHIDPGLSATQCAATASTVEFLSQ